MLTFSREFLEFFSLDFTLAVFDPETNLGKDFQYRGRGKLIDALGLTELVDPNIPLLGEIMRLSKVQIGNIFTFCFYNIYIHIYISYKMFSI